MARETFKDWLGERVGSNEGQVSRRELARRLVEQHPGEGDSESYRRSIRRILSGERVPTQPTRDAIQEALNDSSAPSLADEESDSAISHEEMTIWQRVNRKLVSRAV